MGGDPGMGTWDYAHCLPYFKRMEDCLAAAPDDPFRGHDGPLVLERGPATGPLFGAFFQAAQQAGYRAHRRRQRLPPGGLRAVRPQHPPGPSAERGACLPPSGHGPAQPASGDPRLRDADPLRGPPGGRRRVHPRPRPVRQVQGGGGHPLRWRLQLAAAPAAVGRRAGGPPWLARRTRSWPTCRASGSISRTTWRCTSSTAASCPCRCSRRCRSGAGRGSASSGSSCGAGPGATNHFEGGGFVRGDDRGGLPQPDVPLPAAGHPLRRQLAGRRPRLPGPRGPHVLRRPRLGAHHEPRSARPSGHPLQLPLDRAGPARVAGGRRGRPRTSSTSRRCATSTPASCRPARP